MNRRRRPLGAALSALLVLALASPAMGQDQPLPSEEPAPAPPPQPRPRPAPRKAAPAKPAPVEPAPRKATKPAPAQPAEPVDDAAAPPAEPPAEEPAQPTPEPAVEEAGAEPVAADPSGADDPGAEPSPAAAPDADVAHRAEPRPASDRGVTPAPAVVAAPSPDADVGPAEATVVLSYGPRVLDYEEGDSIPNGYVKDRRMRTGLVVGGAVTLGLTWLASCGAAAYFIWNDRRERDPMVDGFNDIPGEAALAIPLAGPFVAIDTVDPNPAGMALLVADGVIQVGALTMLITGLASKETVLVRTEATAVALSPSAGPGQGGMSLSGTF